MSVKDFILEYIQREYTFPTDVDVLSIDYRAEGYVDSLGMIMFFTSIEDEFGIEFSDDEMQSPALKTVGGLITTVEKKIVKE